MTITKNAANVGLELSSYMRVQSTGKPVMKAHRRIRADWQELQRCMGVIDKAGNVVNQLVLLIRRVGGNPAAANEALIKLSQGRRRNYSILGKG